MFQIVNEMIIIQNSAVKVIAVTGSAITTNLTDYKKTFFIYVIKLWVNRLQLQLTSQIYPVKIN